MADHPCPTCGGPREDDGACPWCRTLAMKAGEASTTAVAPPGVPPASWKRMGKYFLTERLGQGGMGEVWKALDTELGRPVALKFLKAGDDEELVRFRREAQTAASLHHANIAAIYEVGDIEGRHFIAMSYVHGRTLGRFPREDRKLLIRLVRDAARAVDYAHREGIIHRDLKPENLMTSEGPSGWQITVLDFGLARPIEGGQTLSKTGLVLGTPAYMSPEQTRGEKLDARTDVYSLGATLYELLAGRPPFLGTNPYDIASRVLNQDAAPLRKLNPKIHQDLETITQRCLEKERERRYSTAAELADDLDRFLEGEPILARPSGAGRRLLRYCAKRRGAITASTLGVLLLALGGVYLRERARTTAYLAEMRRGRDVWEEAVKATAAGQSERARGLAAEALERFEAAGRAQEAADAWVLRGRCLQVLGRSDDARTAWDRAMDLEPDNREARYQSAKLRLLAYQKLRGTPLFQPYASGGDDHAPPQLLEDLAPESAEQAKLRREAEALLAGGDPEKTVLLRGLLALGSGRFPEAADLLHRYDQSEPWDLAALRLQAIAAFYAGAYERAAASLDRVIADGPDAQAYLWRGIVNLRRRHDEAAFADSTRAIQLDPGLTWAYRNRARAHRYRGDVDAALDDLRRALELEPEAYVTYIERAYVRNVYRGDLEGALADADRAVELRPGSAFALQSRASIQAALGDLEGVVRDASRALELEPARSEALLLLVPAKLSLGDVEGARSAADQAVAHRVAAEPLRARAAVRVALNDVPGAREDLDRALELDPRSYRAYLDRARIRDPKGAAEDRARALAEVEQSLERRPRDPRGHVRRGQVLEVLGDRAGALEAYSRALELDPKLGPAWAARAALRLASGDFQLALDDAGRALRPLPLLSGTALLGLGRYPDAVRELTRAVERSGEGRVERALAYLGLGENSRAESDLEAAARIGEPERLALLRWVASAPLDRARADAALEAVFRERNESERKGWYRRAAEMLLGRLPEGDLRAILGPGEPERACEADLYVGARRAAARDLAGAKEAWTRAAGGSARRDLAEALAASVLLRIPR